MIIVVAIGLSAVRVLLPDVKAYRSYVEQQLALVLEHPVQIGDINALISGITPIVIFHDVKLMSSQSDKELLEIRKIQIGFSLWNSIRQGKAVPSIYKIDGVELAIIRQSDGRILIQDIDVAELGSALSDQKVSTNTELSDWLFKRSSVVIQNSSIVWHDKKRLTSPTYFEDVTLKLKNNRNRHQLNGEFILSSDKTAPKRLDLALDVYGDMLNPIKWVGKFYAKGTNINAAEWGIKPVIMDVLVEQGDLDFQLWGDWIAGELNKIQADIIAKQVVMRRLKNDAVANVPLLSGFVKWEQDEQNWGLLLDNLKFTTEQSEWPTTRINISKKMNNNQQTTVTDIQYCRLDDVRDLLLKSGYVENKIFNYLYNASPSGELRNIKYEVTTQEDNEDQFLLSAEVNNLSLKSYKQVPGLKNVSGNLYSNHNSGVLSINSNDAEIEFKDILTRAVHLKKLNGTVQWVKSDNAWDISSEEITASNKDMAVAVGFSLNLPDDDVSPLLDLQSKITRGKAAHIKEYLPKILMQGKFKQWMENALQAGNITDGRIIVNGRLNEFPYRHNNGRFMALLTGDSIKMNYRSDWPLLTEGKLDILFSGQSMNADVQHAAIGESTADNFNVNIADFKNPLLKIKAHIKSNLNDIAEYSSNTFLKQSRDFVVNSRFSGVTNIDLFLDIPLSKKVEGTYPFNVKAKAFLKKASFSTAKDKIVATNINGVIDLTKNSATARDIDAVIMGGKSKVDIFTRHEFGGHPVRFIMRGNIDVSKTMKTFKLPGYDKVNGRTDWQGVFTLKHKQDGVIKNPVLQVTADMDDVLIDLPSPMTKKEKMALPVYMIIENVSKKDMLLNLIYGQSMSYALDIDLSVHENARLRRGHFSFSPEVAELPEDESLLISGSLYDFSLRDWLDALDATTVKKKKPFFGIPVKVNMDYFHVAKAKDKKPRKPTDPRKLPTFEGEIGMLKYDTFPYGRTRFKTSIEKKGLRLDTFTISSPYVEVKGNGLWRYKPHKQTTELTMSVKSENYGNLLTSLGFASIIENGVANFSGDFNWQGGFGDFRWEKLNGIVTMDITNGVFSKVDPGAGRLLGLLSIETLPSMLFSGDAFSKGLNFDRIVGNYEILDGDAYSDDVSISGPVVNILVTGRTGIVARDFDHYLTVVPNVSGTLPLTSGAIFGPQVGAIVYFFKKLFGAGIDESSQRIYHLTGTWKKPVTTRIDNNVDSQETDQQPFVTDDTEDSDDS